jgi:hypothetical protein
VRDFSAVIQGAESAGAGYNAYNRGVAGDSKEPLNLTGMTVGEIKRRQSLPKGDPERLFAVGAYQVIPDTLNSSLDALGISDDALFDEELQNRIFTDSLIQKQPALHQYLIGESDDLDSATLGAADEWAGLPDYTTGKSVYGGKGGNAASARIEDVRSSLLAARENVKALVEKGASYEDALRIALVGGTYTTPRVPIDDSSTPTPKEKDPAKVNRGEVVVAEEKGYSPEYKKQVSRYDEQVSQVASQAGLANWKASGAIEGQQQHFIDEATVAISETARKAFEEEYQSFIAEEDKYSNEALSAQYVNEKKASGKNPDNDELEAYLEQERLKRQAQLDALERARTDLWGIK